MSKWMMVLGMAGILAAATGTEAGVNGREHRQRERIQQGIRTGDLTAPEAARLFAQQARIRAEEHRYRRDGVVTPRERADLQRDLNRTSRSIHRQRSDGQER